MSALPVAALLVQLLHVASAVSVGTRPSSPRAGEDVVRVGRVAAAVHRRAALRDALALVSALLAECRSSTLVATTTPL